MRFAGAELPKHGAVTHAGNHWLCACSGVVEAVYHVQVEVHAAAGCDGRVSVVNVEECSL